MSFLSGIYNAVKNKQAEMKDRKEFLDMVDEKAKPIRRTAYMQQMLKEVVQEGVAKAKLDAEKRIPKEKKSTPQDFGMKEPSKESEDPWKFLETIGVAKEVIGKEVKDQKTKLKNKK